MGGFLHPFRQRPGERHTAQAAPAAAPAAPAARKPNNDRLRTVHETSAGGLVIDGLDGPQRHPEGGAHRPHRPPRPHAVVTAQGHIELGETAEQTAIREVAEETGLQGSALAAPRSIDYWFVTEGRRVHKTVHHYLMRFLGGELSDDDVEVTEVAWVPPRELPPRLRRRAQARRGGRRTHRQTAHRRSGRPAAPAPAPPRRRPQTHSRTRNHRTDDSAHTQPGRRANGCGPGS